MGSSPSKIFKKATSLPRKIVKTVQKNPAILLAAAPFVAPAAFAGTAGGLGSFATAAGRRAILTSAMKRAAINAAAQKLSGGDIDFKSALASGAIGASVPAIGPIQGIQSDILREGLTGGITSLGTQAVLGRDIDLGQAALSGGISAGLAGLQQAREGRPLFGQQDTGTDEIADTDLIEQQIKAAEVPQEVQGMEMAPSELTPTAPITNTVEDYDAQTAQIGSKTYGTADMPSDVELAETGRFGQTVGKEKIPITGEGGRIDRFKSALSTFGQTRSVGSALDVLKEVSGTAIDRPNLSIAALSSIAASAAAPQQPGESDEEYQKRLSEVEQYVRRYGANLNLPQEQINRILSNVRAESSGDVRLGAAMGGIMDVPVRQNSMGVKELDYRQEGGFVPVGEKEKADDVPAMLSKNEFVMTADAVRGAGNGDIEKGAQKMYDTMKRLESKIA